MRCTGRSPTCTDIEGTSPTESEEAAKTAGWEFAYFSREAAATVPARQQRHASYGHDLGSLLLQSLKESHALNSGEQYSVPVAMQKRTPPVLAVPTPKRMRSNETDFEDMKLAAAAMLEISRSFSGPL